ncbi:hypothetical protein HK097_011576 [Rhizophlyctis rosea]|uniref:Uncharacterized protein n=1 Tax=Rhizophlyctis rosea TaxID=64517 RepID=A0AAD5S633_9FUNG|nr:hypothetical protein HK097_011576 [Rhizophlyctis rosea]
MRPTALLVFLLGVFAPAMARLSKDQIVSRLGDLTVTAAKLVTPAQQINLINGVLIVSNAGPLHTVVTGLKGVAEGFTTATTALAGTGRFSNPTSAEDIHNALNRYTIVQARLLNELRKKAGLLARIFSLVGTPTTDGLEELRKGTNAFTLEIIKLVQPFNQKSEIVNVYASSQEAIAQTIKARSVCPLI